VSDGQFVASLVQDSSQFPAASQARPITLTGTVQACNFTGWKSPPVDRHLRAGSGRAWQRRIVGR
jgi:hypothetical protein